MPESVSFCRFTCQQGEAPRLGARGLARDRHKLQGAARWGTYARLLGPVALVFALFIFAGHASAQTSACINPRASCPAESRDALGCCVQTAPRACENATSSERDLRQCAAACTARRGNAAACEAAAAATRNDYSARFALEVRACELGWNSMCVDLPSTFLMLPSEEQRSERARMLALLDRACTGNYFPACVEAATLRFREELQVESDERRATMDHLVLICEQGELAACSLAAYQSESWRGPTFENAERVQSLSERACSAPIDAAALIATRDARSEEHGFRLRQVLRAQRMATQTLDATATSCARLASQAERELEGVQRDLSRAASLYRRACELRPTIGRYPECAHARRLEGLQTESGTASSAQSP